MPLVEYSDSESNSSADEAVKAPLQASRKRKHDSEDGSNNRRKAKASATTHTTTSSAPSLTPHELPSLPSTFHSLYASNVRTSTHDDPSLHAGRTRQTPHIEGNWPTHIYLEWYPNPTELASLSRIITSTQTTLSPTSASTSPPKLHTLLHTSLHAQLPLHISLSSPLTLLTPQKSPFLDLLEKSLTTSLTSRIKPFILTTSPHLRWLPNNNHTRWFLVLTLHRPGGDELNKLLSVCNSVVGSFGLSKLYEEDDDRSHSFHISIAWTLQDPNSGMMEIEDEFEIRFDVLKVKIGNVVHEVPLDSSKI